MRKIAAVVMGTILSLSMLFNVAAANGDNYADDIFTTANQQTTTQKTTTQKTTTQAATTQKVTTQATTTTAKTETTSVSKPKKAVISKAVNVKGKKISLKIKTVKNADGYNVNYALKKSFKGGKNVYGKKLSYTLKGLKVKKTYYVRVRAYVTGDSGKTYGTWSNVSKVKIKK